MDKYDFKILDCLQKDARITNVSLAEQINLSPAPCLRRVRDLEKRGIIKGYTTLVDAGQVGLHVSVFVEVRLEKQILNYLSIFEERIQKYPEVMECYQMTGASDYLLRIVSKDLPSFQTFIAELASIPNLATIQSSIALKQVKYKTALPVVGEGE